MFFCSSYSFFFYKESKAQHNIMEEYNIQWSLQLLFICKDSTILNTSPDLTTATHSPSTSILIPLSYIHHKKIKKRTEVARIGKQTSCSSRVEVGSWPSVAERVTPGAAFIITICRLATTHQHSAPPPVTRIRCSTPRPL